MAYTIWGGQETPRRSCGEENILMAAKTSEGETGGVALGSATLQQLTHGQQCLQATHKGSGDLM